jgi:7-cyano-7-deazaguanine synthase
MKKAIVLLSGGLDSTTTLAIAKNLGFEIHALSFSYGQRHKIELEAAKTIALEAKVAQHKIAQIDLRLFGHSALTDNIAVPKNQLNQNKEIPITYVPARNTIFLSFALAFGETINAFDIFIGTNAIDYSNYPDCRSEFIAAFEKMANLACAATVENKGSFKIHTPLAQMSKAQIIETGLKLGVDYSQTHSCYDPIVENNLVKPCGKCDSCLLRIAGFQALNKKDPLHY